MSFAASANVIARLRAKPVFVDIDLYTRNIDVEQVPAAITQRPAPSCRCTSRDCRSTWSAVRLGGNSTACAWSKMPRTPSVRVTGASS